MKYWILVSVVIMSSSAIPSPWNNYPGFGSDHHHYGHQQQHNCDSSSEEWSDSDFGSDTQPWKDSSGSWGSGNWKDWVWPNHNKHPWHSWSGTTNPPQTKPPIPTTKPTTKRPSTWSTSKPRPPSTNLPPKKPSNSTTTTTRSPILQVTPSSSLGACMTGCPVTSEYNPVCGSNGITYNNIGRLDCAKSCGVAVEVVRESRCPTDGVIHSCYVFKFFSTWTETCEMDYHGCIKTTLQKELPRFAKGLPEIGVGSLDPFVVEKLDLALGPGLNIEFRNGQARGLQKCVVEFARLVKDTLESQYLCNVTVKGKYKSTGRLLMFPINGDGDASIKCRNLKIHSVIKLKSSVQGDGIEYLEITNSKTNHSYEGRISYNLTNIFKGSPEMSKIVLDFMNNNWQMVAQEFGDPVVDFGISVIMKNVRQLIKMMPGDRLLKMPLRI